MLNGKKLLDRGFEAEEVRYPPGWIALATPEEREALGITEVPDPVWPDRRYYDVVENEDGSLTVTGKPLADVIAASHAAIDAAAGAARARYITTASGQESTYMLKAADADRYKAAGYPAAQIASYPWVEAKARSMSATPAANDYQAAADLIIATRDAWVLKGAAIEEARERWKLSVSDAADIDGVAAAHAAAEEELGAI